jgi:hypothetical protein
MPLVILLSAFTLPTAFCHLCCWGGQAVRRNANEQWVAPNLNSVTLSVVLCVQRLSLLTHLAGAAGIAFCPGGGGGGFARECFRGLVDGSPGGGGGGFACENPLLGGGGGGG